MRGIRHLNSKKISIIGAVLLLSFVFVYQLFLANADSQTTDEAVHLSAGYKYLTTNDYRFNPEHPPLVKKMAALPLLALTIKEPVNAKILWEKAGNFFYDSWRENREYGEKLMYESGNDSNLILFLSRIGTAILTVLLGLTIFLFARYLWGDLGGLFALALYSLDPTVTAHGHLVTTDIAASLGLLLTLISFYFFIKNTTWKNTIWFGLALGFALLSKYTLIIAVPILAIYYLTYLFRRKEEWKHLFKTSIGKIVVSLLITWAVIIIGYGFNFSLAPKTDSIGRAISCSYDCVKTYSGTADKIVSGAYSVVRYLLVPKDYFKGLVLVLNHVSNGNQAFLLGHVSETGWWYYFPVLFFFKTPLPTLLLIGWAAYLLVKNPKTRKISLYLLSGALIFLLFAMRSKANLGLRHILPIYPLLFVLAGGLLEQVKQRGRTIAWILIAILALEFARIQPFDMGYFNQFAGGSNHGYKIATDSNLDWGQDIKRIHDYIKSENLTDVTVVYNWDGQAALEQYGILAKSMDEFEMNQTGTLIVNASSLSSSRFDFLEGRKPDDYVSPGTLVYRFK